MKPISTEALFSSKRCLAWFHNYAGPDKVFGPEAMERFCEDIGVEPENVSLPLFMMCKSFPSFWHLNLGKEEQEAVIFVHRVNGLCFLSDYHVSFSLASRSSKYGILHKRRVASRNDYITVRFFFLSLLFGFKWAFS